MTTARKRRQLPRRHAAGGRFLLRLPPAMHRRLQMEASAAGLSLNEYSVRRLAAPGSGLALERGAARLVERAGEVAGVALVGVVMYGSWMRGEATPASDVDALVVIDRKLPLTRDLYRVWDTDPAEWNGAVVDPHFVHVPPEEEPAGGVWAEVAIDGLVLWERALEISTRLARVRRDIASGRLVRRMVHGQPYWTAA